MSEKRRAKTRVEVSLLPVSIHGNENDISGKALNISLDGIAVKCSTFERDKITPKGDYTCAGKPLVVNLLLNLPNTQKSDYALKAKCRIVYSRRLTQDECQLGMYFLEMDASAKEHLMKFVASHC